jgi:hypothetical protein
MESLAKLKRLLDNDYKIEKIQPPVFASDAEVNIVTVTLLCPDGTRETIRGYREESGALREYIKIYTRISRPSFNTLISIPASLIHCVLYLSTCRHMNRELTCKANSVCST